ncbi:MAG: cell division protein ZipA [Proteobacteria bacterium]|nr:cell division protein ZipA [Pseudomonadota bacterium]MCH9048033.1 cell division protein ZipA [Pseudomonadota bacterium]
MNDLRLILLGIGLFIIAIIYLWGTFYQKLQDRSHLRKLTSFKRSSSEVIKPMPTYDDDDEVSTATLAELDKFLTNQKLPDIDASDFSLSAKASTTDKATQPIPDIQIITLLIKASPGKEFSGVNILNAIKTVGFRFGNMNIFHHHGVEGLMADQPLFSLASMYEPGCFELEQMETYKTKGLALFMQLPSPVDNVATFDLMQETVMRLTDMLQGEIWSSKQKPIDKKTLQAMRDVAAEFS